MSDPFSIVREFEAAIGAYAGAPYAVAVNSCTMALLLACSYNKVGEVNIPKRTYVGVAQSILNAGGHVTFRDEQWKGEYQLKPYPIWDAARRFTSGMYRKGTFQCISFHISKILGIDQGGAILHDDPVADKWLRKARFDGRTEGIHPRDDTFIRGFHCYMSPPIAAQGLWRLACLPRQNSDLENSDYSDLSLCAIFRPSSAAKSVRTSRPIWSQKSPGTMAGRLTRLFR